MILLIQKREHKIYYLVFKSLHRMLSFIRILLKLKKKKLISADFMS